MASAMILLFLCFSYVFFIDNAQCSVSNMIEEEALTTKAFVFWPNGTIPFYIDEEHFDKEQQLSILSTLALFAFKTCLKFAPVMARPEEHHHVLVLENPTAIRKCTINTEPHSVEEPHCLTLGYDCLKSPHIEMVIMKALGFPFEHNRAVRDLYIEVHPENIEQGYSDLFTKDLMLPLELRSISYDINSVMHFGERDFSKNGHRTITFKNRRTRQERFGLSPLDLRKIDMVYGPECRRRDRQEKIELCQNYPGVVRRKRDVTEEQKSLRVNPDITPPPDVASTTPETAKEAESTNEDPDNVDKVIKELGVEKEVEDVVDRIHKITAAALAVARIKYCVNKTKSVLRTSEDTHTYIGDVLGTIANYAKSAVEHAKMNLTKFCEEPESIHEYQRSHCVFGQGSRCIPRYRSTLPWHRPSTNLRPWIQQSTHHRQGGAKNAHALLNVGQRRSDDAPVAEDADHPQS